MSYYKNINTSWLINIKGNSVENMFDISGKIAIVTGGSRGIGKMIAEGFVRAGAKTYITARSADVCEETAKELSQFGTCIAIPKNISTVAEIEAFVAEFSKLEDKLDILVNNAGTAWGEPFDDFSEEGWDKVMDLNVKSLFFMTQKCAPLLRAAATAEKPAKVINIASIDGIYVTDNETYSYVASKSAVIHLTKRLSKRLIQDNINVNAIAPGAFASKMNAVTRDHPDAVAKSIPNRRIGRPEDMAGTAIYMASMAGDYLVGTTINVDGGVCYASSQMPSYKERA